MGVLVRDWTHWALGYAPSRAALSLLRRGDPLAKLLTIDTHPVDDIYPLIEQVRQRGQMSPIPKMRCVGHRRRADHARGAARRAVQDAQTSGSIGFSCCSLDPG